MMSRRSRSLARALVPFLTLALCGCANYWLLYPGMADSTNPHIDPAASGNNYEVPH